MKPALGRTVYCIYEESILVERVGYIGNDSFIIEDFSDNVRFDSLEWFYEDYQNAWFTSLARAKNKLLQIAHRKYPNKKFNVKKITDTYYEFEEMKS